MIERNWEAGIVTSELVMVQDIITRMSNRQQNLKNLCLIIVGLMTSVVISNGFLMTHEGLKYSMLLQVIIIIGSWKLDMNYLKVERVYRLWYDFILAKRRLSSNEYLFTLNLKTITMVLENQPSSNPKPVRFWSNWSLNIYILLLTCLVFLYGSMFYSKLVFRL